MLGPNCEMLTSDDVKLQIPPKACVSLAGEIPFVYFEFSVSSLPRFSSRATLSMPSSISPPAPPVNLLWFTCYCCKYLSAPPSNFPPAPPVNLILLLLQILLLLLL